VLRIPGQTLGLIEYERGILLRHPESCESHRTRVISIHGECNLALSESNITMASSSHVEDGKYPLIETSRANN
jgi:hypothetical protein